MALYKLSLLGLSERSHSLMEYGLSYDVLDDDYNGEIYEYLTEEERYKAISLLEDQIQRGDIVKIIEAHNYSDDGKLIYDGKDLIAPYQPEEWISPPSSFYVGDEFLVDHWINSIGHEYLVSVNTLKHRKELLKNLNETYTSFTTHLGTFTIEVVSGSDINAATKSLKLGIEICESMIFSTHNDHATHIGINPYKMYYTH